MDRGPQGLIEVLRAALGDGGTLVMPSMTDDDDHPFDPRNTPCPGLGATANSFWQLPEVLRSDRPHAFAAMGPLAERITAPHPLSPPHGPDSPVGRVHELGGYVPLVGVGHDANTTVHLAEYMSGVRYRRRKHAPSCKTVRPPASSTRRLTTAASTSRWWMGGWASAGCSGEASWDTRSRDLHPRKQSWTS